MKNFPSYTTLNNINSTKKVLTTFKYEKPVSNISNVLNAVRSANQTLTLKKKQSSTDQNVKKNIDMRKDLIMDKVKTQVNESKNGASQKQDYEALKNRLHALQDRLVQIKKSYQLRKNKSQHFSIQKFSPKFSNKENQKNQKLNINKKKQLKIQTKVNSIQNKTLEQRFAVQSPKAQPLQQKKNKLIKHKQNEKSMVLDNQNSNSEAIISEYVTQYEQKPIAFKHTTSQTNLLKSSIRDKSSDMNKKEKNAQIYYVSAIINAIETNNPNSFDQLCTSHLIASYQFLCYIKNANIQKPKKPIIRSLPPCTKKHTIVFDLDQTLIHCVDTKKSCTSDITIPIIFPDRNKVTVGINIRPYTKQCLKQLSKYFEIMIFTASHLNYANAIVDYLDPDKQFISQRYSRQNCHKTEQGFYVKDLRVIDRKLSNVLLIDNAAYSYCFQPQNGIPIVPFYDNKADLQLKNLIPYLKSFIHEQDVRVKNNQTMKLTQYTKYKGPQDLINKLYK